MFAALVGKKLALLTWGKDASGEDEVWLHTGILVQEGGDLILDRRPDKAGFKIRQEWIPKIKPTRSDLTDILGDAELVLSLTVRALPKDVDLSQFEFTGLTED